MDRYKQPEQNVSEALMTSSRFIHVKGTKLHYVDEGEGDPVPFLHGIPANLYLWRNVMPIVTETNRAIALDLAGFGQSDVPAAGGYDANNQYTYLEGFINQLGLKNLTLVITDLGALLGMKYAAAHPENVAGIVAAEALILPATDYYNQLSGMQKMMYSLFRNKWLARSIIVNGTRIQSNIVPMMTARRLSAVEKYAYARPYLEDVAKRSVVFEGPGPVGFPKKRYLSPQTATNEAVIMMNESAARLKGTSIPMLLLYSNPGVVMSGKGVALAAQWYPNLTALCIGRGKHFMAEEHPTAMAYAIHIWLETVVYPHTS